MQQIKALLVTLFAGGITFFLFFVGLGFMLAVFVIMMLMGLLVKPSTRQRWRERWSQNWQQRQAAYRTRENSPRREHRVIEGEYVVKSH